MANEKKLSQLDTLMELLGKSHNFALLTFEKTTHITLEGLRKDLKKNESNVKVIKNTLFEKAVNKLAEKDEKFGEFKKKSFPIKENTALLFLGHEWNKGLKAFYDFSQKEKSVGFKVGMLDHTVYNNSDLLKIAQLPSKEILVAKVLGSMKSPIAHFTHALQFNTQKLVYILNQRAQQTS